MKCPKCNGRGTVGYYHIDHFVDIECDRCHGSGEVGMTNDITILSCPQCGFPRIRDVGNGLYQCDDCGTHFDKDENVVLTNEEWFCGLSTEEKAKWMAKHMSFCEVCEIQTCRGDGCQRFDRGSMTETDAFREWLKEKHHAN